MKENNTREYISLFYKDNKFNYFMNILVALATAGLYIFVSWILQVAIDIATGTTQMAFSQIIVIALVFMIGTVLIMVLNAYFFPKYVKTAMTNYKNTLLQKFLSKDISEFQNQDSSVYLSTLTNDAKAIEDKYITQEINLLTEIITLIGALAFMLYFSPVMTLVSVGLTILPIIASFITGGKLVEIEQVISEKNANFVAIISDFTKGFPIVKNFKADRQILESLKDSNENLEQSKKELDNTKLTISLMTQSTGIFTQLAVTLFGAYLVLQDQGFTAGMIVSFVNLMNFIISPVVNVPTMVSERRAALGLINKAANIVHSPVNYDKDNEIDIQPLKRAIHLQDVHFAYNENQPILQGLDLAFEKAKSYALVGGSGSGKTTLMTLLMKENNPNKGQVMYDEIDLRNASLDSLYEEISMIQQDVFVFNASILDNITMFQTFDKDTINEVIDRSSLRKLVDNKGLDFMCGENGANLSGGEQQRIAIARALLKNSSIILADEATSSLDKETAFQITNDLLNLTDKTRIMITHSLDRSLLERYDEIIVLKDGNIVEKGSFKKLIERDGYFNKLYAIS